METKNENIRPQSFWEFKSYYVVWKHDSQKIPVFSLICSNHTILNIPKSYKQ